MTVILKKAMMTKTAPVVAFYVLIYWGRPEMFMLHIIKHKTLNFALMTTLITHFFMICYTNTKI